MVGRHGGGVQDPQAGPRSTIAADDAAWFERQSIAAEDAPAFLPADLARSFFRDALGQRGQGRGDHLTPPEPDGAATPGHLELPPLCWSREVISALLQGSDLTGGADGDLQPGYGNLGSVFGVRRYVHAVQKVDQAHRLLVDRIKARAARASTAWDLPRAQKLYARADAVERRRQATELCTSGRDFVAVYRCTRCSTAQVGVPLTCNSRVCPRCVALLRNRATAHLRELLELTDQRRLREHRPKPMWRFVTLTVPSLPEFLPMKRWMAAAWSRLLRRQLWTRNVKASVASWETTHSRAGWHVHVHALVDAFLPRARLVREWQDACLRELLNDAAGQQRSNGNKHGRRELWQRIQRADLLPETVRGARKLLRLSRTIPSAREGSNHRVDVHEGALPFEHVELSELVGGGSSLRWGFYGKEHNREGEYWTCTTRWEPVCGDDAAATAQLRELLAMLPTGKGIHQKETTGDRQSLVRELAKYLAKDLAGATTGSGIGYQDDTWGVAGTAERLAEFMDGSFRWRALRTYGDCFNASAELDALQNGQCCCECGGELEWEQVAVVEPGEQVPLPRCGHEAERLQGRDRPRAMGPASPPTSSRNRLPRPP